MILKVLKFGSRYLLYPAMYIGAGYLAIATVWALTNGAPWSVLGL